ncbi:murein hydrolase activator EnvC family protein [Solidesulfovibrio sp.]|uniref:murein hydrolase activator EnvC family protein n=1 Tax=Solidesulfovibrio sp. TaxID=2910990 RepID=UPI002B21FFFD|nr:peptidoglycan DD-metalloendopeptidase family protein [Solidesulfovibrio sp.]MEA5089452.1 peptidoglycan DD-metalloendopeptidase family protein [Solidesulfovibrio sp.]
MTARRGAACCLCLAAALSLGLTPALPRALAARQPRETRETRPAAAREAERGKLAALLFSLWARQVERAVGAAGEGKDWAEADRRQVWARLLYEALAGGEGTAPTARDKAPARAKTERPEARADVALSAPATLEAPPGEPDTFAVPQSGLEWPATGRVAAAFAPGANPPRQGVVLKAAEGTPVVAAADGEVVFCGALRGLGRIVILDHGDRRHTVYGCLGQAAPREGDYLRRGEALGVSGLCGITKAPGVYFELRFREKALNPAEWLAARR